MTSDHPARRLSMTGICKAFGGVPVLRDVVFEAARGEVVGLLGSNGAGKSTLVKILSGIYGGDGGDIAIDGGEVRISRPVDAIGAGIRLLPQELSVHPDMSVAENIFVADPPTRPLGPLRLVDGAAMKAAAARLLENLGLGHIDPGVRMKRLGAPEQRIVEIARAMMGEARVLILDEPTAALTEQETRLLFAAVRQLGERGVSIVYISHYLDEVFDICDRIVVLRDGANAGEFDPEQCDHRDVLHAMLGAAVRDLYPPRRAGERPTETVLSVQGLRVGKTIRDVSLNVGRGEIFGVFGLIGSGIDVLGRALYGALGRPDGGVMTLGGRSYEGRDIRAAKDAGVGLVAAERKREGILPDLTLRENMTLPFIESLRGGLMIDRQRERSIAGDWIGRLGIRARGPEQRVRFLSGGNQQKVCIARWLIEKLDLLILEEPTRGVDVGARQEIYAMLRGLADQGLSILLVSSDVDEVAGLCDRGVALARGRVALNFAGGADAAEIMQAAAGGRIPA